MPDYRAIGQRHALIPAGLDEDHTLNEILALMLCATPADMVAIMLTNHGRVEPRVSTHSLAQQADQLQLSLREGPSISVDPAHDIVRIDHTIADPRWPHWGPAAARLGIGSVLSLRMTDLSRATIGSITLYAHDSAVFAPNDVELGAVLVRAATLAYRNARDATTTRQAVATVHRNPVPGLPAPRVDEPATDHAPAGSR